MHSDAIHSDFDVADGIHTTGPSTVRSTSVFNYNQSPVSSNEKLLLSDFCVEKTIQWNMLDMVNTGNELCKVQSDQNISVTSETGDVVGQTIEHSNGDVHAFVFDSERNGEICCTDGSSVSLLTKIDVENVVPGVHNTRSGLNTCIKDKSNERGKEVNAVEEQNNGDAHLCVHGTEMNEKNCCLGIDQGGSACFSSITADNSGTSDVKLENNKGKFVEKKKLVNIEI